MDTTFNTATNASNGISTPATADMFAQNGVAIPCGTRVLRMAKAFERMGVSRSTGYAIIKSDPTFPKKVQLSARTVGVIEHQLDAWIASRVA
ncbi:helix-turn-helix transcriptional regulator [Paraburkholderia tropica]|uniref:helix-turn-helix transcriptional regulator n=1 Tax=Paraburkholderia tropica TaxID=92647 RepID=UPI002AB0A9D3|nr:AlpA family phage regulatory protein [Paraburkholderia tropica]